MDFLVGQNVVHPVHGAGEVINIVHDELVEGFEHFYEIEFVTKRLTMHVPFSTADDVGVRKVMSESKIDHVLDTLHDIDGQLPSKFKTRKKQIEDLLGSGRPVKIAEAVRELAWRKRDSRLTQTDTRLLSQGKDMLISEIALANDMEIAEAREAIDEALLKAIDTKQAEQAA